MTTSPQQLAPRMPPWGGPLVELRMPEDLRKEVLARAGSLLALALSERSLCEPESLAFGGFAPRRGVLGRKDGPRVIDEMWFADRTLWPRPVTLQVPMRMAGPREARPLSPDGRRRPLPRGLPGHAARNLQIARQGGARREDTGRSREGGHRLRRPGRAARCAGNRPVDDRVTEGRFRCPRRRARDRAVPEAAVSSHSIVIGPAFLRGGDRPHGLPPWRRTKRSR